MIQTFGFTDTISKNTRLHNWKDLIGYQSIRLYIIWVKYVF